MIKGVDTQVMTQRAAEYSKDVSAMLRRDELSNEFADRMNKLNARQEAKTVAQLEKAEHARVRGDQEKEAKQGGHGGGRRRPGGRLPGTGPLDEEGLPSVGEAKEQKLLDIEV